MIFQNYYKNIDTEDVYNKFISIINENKDLFNDKSNYDEQVKLSKQDMIF